MKKTVTFLIFFCYIFLLIVTLGFLVYILKMAVNPEIIENLGFEIRCGNKPRSVQTTKKRFKALYGTDSEVIFYVWNQLIINEIIEKYDKNRLKRFFLMFDFLKNYCIEHRCAMDFGIDEKTYRKWVWFYLEKVSKLTNNVVRKIIRRKKISILILSLQLYSFF